MNIGEACQKFFRHTPLIHWLVSVTSSSPIPTAKHTHSSHINSSRRKHIKYWASSWRRVKLLIHQSTTTTAYLLADIFIENS
jgi:hypothetical protein